MKPIEEIEEDIGYVTVQQAAKMIGVHRDAVYQAIDTGKLKPVGYWDAPPCVVAMWKLIDLAPIEAGINRSQRPLPSAQMLRSLPQDMNCRPIS